MADAVSVREQDHQRVCQLLERHRQAQGASSKERRARAWMAFLPLLGLLVACEDQGNPGDDNLLTGGSLVVLIVIAIVIFLIVRRRK